MGKAERTKALLQERALALFLRRGFDETTVVEIAAAAGVSPMTFFRHFATKEAVLLDDPYDPLIAGLILAQDAELSAHERVRRGLLAGWDQLPEPADAGTRDRIRLVAAHPGLRAGTWQNNQRTEDLIVAALVDTGVDPVEARVAAGSVLGGLTAALLHWAGDPAGEALGARIRRALALMER